VHQRQSIETLAVIGFSKTPKVPPCPADHLFIMIAPVSGSTTSPTVQSVFSKLQPQPQPQQNTAQRTSDTVTLKSTGDVDHDGDSK
jgi:hypothetical protein